ncbi:MAG: PilZ domain-containing protein [Pseudomonadota bacterium]|nr:PilZ domain-containing protein [Pseudomonadota bacterium]
MGRACLAALPRALRSRIYRRAINLNPPRRARLELKIAQTQEELEACFALLHDAYVASGLMQPHPSGLRVTPYHALPTTTTLCAKVGGLVVGTLSIVRDGVFGFPMQAAFDVSSVRAKEGRIAEISALAIHPRFRKTGGTILFPLMKFMYEYCTRYFDTRHLLIAVHPSHIEMYESLLFFQRLAAQPVDCYDFVNGAPAIGATLDLHEAPRIFERAYGGLSGARNLHHYFVHTNLPEIQLPSRPWHVSNDPVLTPALMEHFFMRRTTTFDALDERRCLLLHSLYSGPEWQRCLPRTGQGRSALAQLRQSPRISLHCPATVTPVGKHVVPAATATIVEMSSGGFQARLDRPVAVGTRCDVLARLGPERQSLVQARVVRAIGDPGANLFGFRLEAADSVWQRCIAWLEDLDGARADPDFTEAEAGAQRGAVGPRAQPASKSRSAEMPIEQLG